MKKLHINIIKSLFYAYSPLKTNQELLNTLKKLKVPTTNPNTHNIRELYNKLILKSFLNESAIKAAFVKRYGFKKSPECTVTIFELNSCNSRADLCMVNGESVAYEIKTEYDTYIRLDNQLSDYLKLHDYVSVIIPESQVVNIIDITEDNIGIIFYSQNRLGNIVFNEYRQPKLNKQIDSFAQLSQLTKRELINIVGFNTLSKDDLIQQAVLTFNKEEINNHYRKYLKQKYFKKWNFLYANQKDLYPLDYQWFFKNNLPTETVYK